MTAMTALRDRILTTRFSFTSRSLTTILLPFGDLTTPRLDLAIITREDRRQVKLPTQATC
jgi:hypothetical protein